MRFIDVVIVFCLFFGGYACGAVMAVHFGELTCG